MFDRIIFYKLHKFENMFSQTVLGRLNHRQNSAGSENPEAAPTTSSDKRRYPTRCHMIYFHRPQTSEIYILHAKQTKHGGGLASATHHLLGD